MASLEKMEKKLREIRLKLEAIGHVPSQKEDCVLYASVKYYYSNYANNPLVIRLKQDFPFESSRSREAMTREESIEYIKSELERLGRIPGPTENRPLYQKVKYFYENHSDIPDIAELIQRFPLTPKKRESMFVGMSFDEKIDVLERYLRKEQSFSSPFGLSRESANVLRFYIKHPDHPRIQQLRMLFPNYQIFGKIMEQCGNDIVSYFRQCFERYGEIPGEKSIPMEHLWKSCRRVKFLLKSSDDNENPQIRLVLDLINQNIDSKQIKAINTLICKNQECCD